MCPPAVAWAGTGDAATLSQDQFASGSDGDKSPAAVSPMFRGMWTPHASAGPNGEGRKVHDIVVRHSKGTEVRLLSWGHTAHFQE